VGDGVVPAIVVGAELGATLFETGSGAESGFKSNVHSMVEGLSSTVISRRAGEKPKISTWRVQAPAARLLNVYCPESSVVVTIFCSPCEAVTVAPGMASPPERTIPLCWAAHIGVSSQGKSRK
jgi:hypothetical protein